MDDQKFRNILSACDPLDFACTRRVSESLGLNKWAKNMGWRNETLAEKRAREAANAEDAAYGTPEATAARERAREARHLEAERARVAAERERSDARNAQIALQRQRPGYDAIIEYIITSRYTNEYRIPVQYILDKFLNPDTELHHDIKIATLARLINDIYQHLRERQVTERGTMNFLRGSQRAINRIGEIHTELVELARQQAEQAAQMAQAAQLQAAQAQAAKAAQAARAQANWYAAASAAASAAARAAPTSSSRRRAGSPTRGSGFKKKTRKIRR